MNDNELEENKSRGKETSRNALAEIQAKEKQKTIVDGWKRLVGIGIENNE